MVSALNFKRWGGGVEDHDGPRTQGPASQAVPSRGGGQGLGNVLGAPMSYSPPKGLISEHHPVWIWISCLNGAREVTMCIPQARAQEVTEELPKRGLEDRWGPHEADRVTHLEFFLIIWMGGGSGKLF